MSNLAGTPGQTGQSRIFLIKRRARYDHAPDYEGCMKAGAPAAGFGDRTKIECPSPDSYNGYIETASFKGARERPTITLTGRYLYDLKSELYAMAREGCEFDVQIHFGVCTDPSDFTKYTKAMIWEAADISNWSAEDMGALGSDEQAKIDESADLSAKDMYEVVPQSFNEKAGALVTNELVDGVICGGPSCGDCDSESDGCYKAYWISKAAGGSPGTPPDIVHTIDKGVNWYADDIDSLQTAEDPDGVACVGLYIVVVSNDSGSLHYALKSEVDDVDYDETWTEVATGFVATHEPNDIWSYGNGAFIVGDDGYVYLLGSDPTAGVTVLDAGVATAQHLLAVHALSDKFAVAVGNNGAIIHTTDGVTWSALTAFVGIGVNLNCVWCKNEKEWFVGTSNGRLWATKDAGTNWAQNAFPGSGSGVVYDVAFATESVGYLAHATTAPRGRILRTIDSGYHWVVCPETSAIMPLSDRFTAVAACPYDADFMQAGGLGDNGSDGILVQGQA